jgi:hypothetical protein
VTLTNLDLGVSGGAGTLAVAGVQSAVNISGDATIGKDGTGTLVIGTETGAAGTVTIGGGVSVGDGAGASTGTLLLNNSSVLSAGFFLVGGGTGNTGTVVAQGQSLVLSPPGTLDSFVGVLGGSGALVLKEHALMLTGDASGTQDLVFGSLGGTGTLDISANAQLLSQSQVTIGSASGTGSGRVSDHGLLSAATVSIGDAGNGSLVLFGGGLVGSSDQLTSSKLVTVGAHQGAGVLRAFDAARASISALNVATVKGTTGTLSVESDTRFTTSGALTVGSDLAGGGSATVNVDHATLAVGNATVGRGGDQAVLQVANGAHFDVSGGMAIGSNGVAVLTGAGSVGTVGGALAIGGPLAVANANVMAVEKGARLNTHGMTIGNGSTGTLVVDGNTTAVVNTGTVSIGGGGGTGTLALVNHTSFTSTNTITVNTGGTLIGTGDVTGSVVNNGGTLFPGGSPGVMTISGDLTQSADSVITFELFGTDPSQYDQLFVGGNVSLAGTMRLIFDFQPVSGTVFDLIRYNGAADFSGLTAIDLIGIGGSAHTRIIDGALQVAVVPLPSSLTLLLTGVVGLSSLGLGRSGRSRNWVTPIRDR